MRYFGYGDEYDEWRRIEEIVTVDEDEEENDSDLAPSQLLAPTAAMKFCLFDELACRIKSLLSSSRKASPICSIILSFDPLQFDSLILRATKKEKRTKEVYSLSCLTKLDDLLGDGWHIRGINSAGDFCHVEPDSVRFYLKFLKLKPDFQMKEHGILMKRCFGMKSQLVFQFIRSDGTSQQWGSVLHLCCS